MERKFYLISRYSCVAGVIVFGALSSVITKSLNLNDFFFPLFQTMLMAFGELTNGFLVVFFWLCVKKKVKKLENSENLCVELPKRSCWKRLGKSGICISGFFDFLNSLTEYYCYNVLTATNYVSIKMITTYYVLAYRVIFLNRPIHRHQWFGLFLFTLGICLIIFEIIFNYKTNQVSATYAMYIGLMALSELFNAIDFITLEYFIWETDTSPEFSNVIKGSTIIVLCGLSYFPFKYVLNSNDASLTEPYQRLSINGTIEALTLLSIVNLGFYNYFLAKTLQFTDALTFCTIDSGRIVLVLLLSIFFLHDQVDSIEIIGGGLIIIGLIIYNEILILPICGFQKSAKTSMDENKIIRERRQKKRSWLYKLDTLLENK